MSLEKFDPYYKWLGIPPHEQPPDHYRLLGINRFERDRDVIEHAADGRMAILRSFQSGPNAIHCQRLLSQVASARVCLLGPASKQEYDQRLRGTASQSPAFSLSLKTSPVRAGAKPTPVRQRQPTIPRDVQVFAGGTVGLALGYVIICLMSGRDLLDPFRDLREQPRLPVPTAVLPQTPATTRSEEITQSVPKASPAASPKAAARNSAKPKRAEPTPSPESTDVAIITPSPPAPVAPPPPKPTVLSTLGPVLRLPPLSSAGQAEIASFGLEPTDSLSITINSVASDLPPGALTMEAVAPSTQWNIQYAGVVLATLHREGRQLRFAWNQSADPQSRRHLANCRMDLAHAAETKSVQFREPLPHGPLVLDLSKKRQVSTFAIPAAPQPARIYAVVRKLIEFPAGAALRKERAELRIGTAIAAPQVVIEFGSMPGAEIGIRLFPVLTTKESGDYSLSLEPVFHEGEAEFEMTLERLEALRQATEAGLSSAAQELAQINSALSRAQQNFQSLSQSQPSQTNATEYGIWKDIHIKATEQVRLLTTRAKSSEQALEQLNQRSAAIPKMKSFLDSLHQKASIEFQVVAESGDQDLVLVDGTGAAKEAAYPSASSAPSSQPTTSPTTSPNSVDDSLKLRAERAKAAGLDLEPINP